MSIIMPNNIKIKGAGIYYFNEEYNVLKHQWWFMIEHDRADKISVLCCNESGNTGEHGLNGTDIRILMGTYHGFRARRNGTIVLYETSDSTDEHVLWTIAGPQYHEKIHFIEKGTYEEERLRTVHEALKSDNMSKEDVLKLFESMHSDKLKHYNEFQDLQ